MVNAPGWPEVQQAFLNGPIFWASLPGIVGAFWMNVQLFLIAEVLILALGLLLAVMRSLPGPVFFPVRACWRRSTSTSSGRCRASSSSTSSGSASRGSGSPGVPNEPFFWAVVALTLIYSAYVSEVYRAGHRVGPPEPGGRGRVRSACRSSRRCATSSCRRPSGG